MNWKFHKSNTPPVILLISTLNSKNKSNNPSLPDILYYKNQF